MDINKRLKQIRDEFNLNQKDFASKLMVKQSYYSEVENGKRPVGQRIINALLAVFNVSSDWMMTGKGDIYLTNIESDLTEKSDVLNDGIVNKFDKGEDESDKSDGFYPLLNISGGSYEDNKINAYYKLTEYRLNRLLSVYIEDLKRAYTSYQTLCTLSINFGAPDFVNDKFKPYKDFDTFKREVDKDKMMLHGHVTDKKLNTCIRLVHYEEEITHWNEAIYKLISYMDTYFGLYKGKVQPFINSQDTPSKE